MPVPCLKLEECSLALQAPGIAGELAILADHTVTWNNDRDRVTADRLANFVCQSTTTKGLRELPIRDRLSVRNLAKRRPYPFLERIAMHRCSHVEHGPLARQILL